MGLLYRDTFSRSEGDQWGRPDQGNPYVSDEGGTAALDANGASGTITASVAGTRYRAGSPTLSAPWGLVWKARTDKLAVGGTQVLYFVARRIDANNCYLGRLSFNTSAQVLLGVSKLVGGVEIPLFSDALVSGLTHAAARDFLVHFEFDGAYPTVIRGRIWQDNTSEPTVWAFETTDSEPVLQASGGVGAGFKADTGTSNLPVLAAFADAQGDDLSRGLLVTNNPDTYLFRDTFTRSATDQWGNPELGSIWIVPPDAGTAANFDVNGTAGTISVPAAGPGNHQRIGSAVSHFNGKGLFKVQTDKLAVGADQRVYVCIRRIGATSFYFARLTFDTAQAVKLAVGKWVAGVETLFGQPTTIPGLAHAVARDFLVQFMCTGIGPGLTKLQAKVWQDGTTPPDGWQVTTTDNEASLQAAGGVSVGAELAFGASNAPVLVTVAEVSVSPAATPRIEVFQGGTRDAPLEVRVKYVEPSPFGSRIIWARRSSSGKKFLAPWLVAPTPDVDTATVSNVAGYAGGTRNETTFADPSWRRRDYASLLLVPKGTYRIFGRMAKSSLAADIRVRLHDSTGGAPAANRNAEVSLASLLTVPYLLDLGVVDVPADDSTLNLELYSSRLIGPGSLYFDYFLPLPTESFSEFILPAEILQRWQGSEGVAGVGAPQLGSGAAKLKTYLDSVRWPHSTGVALEALAQHVFEFDVEVESGASVECRLVKVGSGPQVAATKSTVGRENKLTLRYEQTTGGLYYAEAVLTSSTPGPIVTVNRVGQSLLRYGRQGQEVRVNSRDRTARLFDSNGAFLRDIRRRYDWPTVAADANEIMAVFLDANGQAEGEASCDRAAKLWHRAIPRFGS